MTDPHVHDVHAHDQSAAASSSQTTNTHGLPADGETAVAELSRLIARYNRVDCWMRWRIGSYVHAAVEAPGKYGGRFVVKAARSIGVRKDWLYDARRVYRAFPDAEAFKTMLARTAEHGGNTIGWSHLSIIAECDDAEAREALVEHWAQTGCGVRDLQRRIQETQAAARAAAPTVTSHAVSEGERHEPADDHAVPADEQPHEPHEPVPDDWEPLIRDLRAAVSAAIDCGNRRSFAMHKLSDPPELPTERAAVLSLKDELEQALFESQRARETGERFEAACQSLLDELAQVACEAEPEPDADAAACAAMS